MSTPQKPDLAKIPVVDYSALQFARDRNLTVQGVDLVGNEAEGMTMVYAFCSREAAVKGLDNGRELRQLNLCQLPEVLHGAARGLINAYLLQSQARKLCANAMKCALGLVTEKRLSYSGLIAAMTDGGFALDVAAYAVEENLAAQIFEVNNGIIREGKRAPRRLEQDACRDVYHNPEYAFPRPRSK